VQVLPDGYTARCRVCDAAPLRSPVGS
jgi:hypothetical protein